MERPITIMSNAHCKNCGTNSIEIITMNGKHINYQKLLNMPEHVFNREINTNTFRFMRCQNCGKLYQIEWVNGVPRPLCDNWFFRSLGVDII